MDIFNHTHNTLIDNNYTRKEVEQIKLLGCDLYEKNDMSVIIYRSRNIDDIDELNVLSLRIRNFLQENDYNFFNSYLLILPNENLNYELFYLIERNNIGVRKYVIKQKEDLERVTFLKFKEDKDTSNPSEEENESINEIVTITLNILESYGYSSEKFNTSKLEEISKKIFEEMEIINENQ